MLRLPPTAVLAATALGAGAAAPVAAPAQAMTREFEGPVTSVKRSASTLALRDTKRKRTITIRVTRSTRYDDLRGYRAIRRGMRLEVKARYTGGRWVARTVEREDDD